MNCWLPRPFNSELIIEEKICEATFRAYNVGFDQNKFRMQPLADIICDVIPEFAFGYHAGQSVPLPQLRRRIKEAAMSIYTSDKYQKRGEFGELILHLLLRDFIGSIPLLSKIYFKDSDNIAVHGFDGVHIVIDGNEKRLWLGESKLYVDGVDGVKELANDLIKHLNSDYLRRELTLISKKLPESTLEIDYWRNLMHENQRLDVILNGITIPIVCTYSSYLFNNHNDNTNQFINDFLQECYHLKEKFEEYKTTTNVDVILMLLPVPCKNELTKELHDRLRSMQTI